MKYILEVPAISRQDETYGRQVLEGLKFFRRDFSQIFLGKNKSEKIDPVPQTLKSIQIFDIQSYIIQNPRDKQKEETIKIYFL